MRKILVRKPEGKKTSEKPGHGCADNIKIDVREIMYSIVRVWFSGIVHITCPFFHGEMVLWNIMRQFSCAGLGDYVGGNGRPFF